MFLNVCHFLNCIGLAAPVAAVRRAIHRFVPCRYRTYSARSQVGQWSGWFEAPLFGVIAFTTRNGETVYRW
jgi:hypothetical protein